MGQAPVIQFTRYPLITKAAVDSDRMSVTAILTYPAIDLAGDYIEPTGGDYTAHKARPWVGLEHYRLAKGTRDELVYPDNPKAGNPIVVGWARESLADPSAPYGVEMKKFLIKSVEHTLPVGTTYYDADNRLSNQVFAMVRQDALPGVSLELQAPKGYAPTVLKARSPLEPHRPAWRYDKWECHAWVNCAKPVNPGALTTKAVADGPLAKILADGCLSTDQGASEPLHHLIMKSFAVAAKPAKVVGGYKAMGDEAPDTDHEQTVYDDAHDEQQGDEQGTPTARAAYNLAQACMDLKQQAEMDLEGSEHKSGKKAILKLLTQFDAAAHKAIAIGDKVVADLSGGDGMDTDMEDGDMEGDEVDPDDEEGDEPDPDDLEEDEEDPKKRLKAFRKPARKIYCKSIRRFTAHEVKVAPVVIELPPEPIDAPEDLERLEKARRARRKAKFIYGD